MSKADVVAVILCAGATLYAIFGGADFGAGIWSLPRGATRRPAPRRGSSGSHALAGAGLGGQPRLADLHASSSSGPGSQSAFGPIMETLYVPLALAAVGIVLRGSGFAFGHTFGGCGSAARERRLRRLLADHAVLHGLRRRRDRRRRVVAAADRATLFELARAAAAPDRGAVRRQQRLPGRGLLDRRLPSRRRGGAVAYFLRRAIAAAVARRGARRRRAVRPARRRPCRLRRARRARRCRS